MARCCFAGRSAFKLSRNGKLSVMPTTERCYAKRVWCSLLTLLSLTVNTKLVRRNWDIKYNNPPCSIIRALMPVIFKFVNQPVSRFTPCVVLLYSSSEASSNRKPQEQCTCSPSVEEKDCKYSEDLCGYFIFVWLFYYCKVLLY